MPPNCKFVVDNAEILPLYGNDDPFDLIHMRQLHWVKDWLALVRQAFVCLAPGGWFEWADLEFLPGESHLNWRRWQFLQHQIYYRSGRSRSARNVAQMLEGIGFTNINTLRSDVLEGEDSELRQYVDTEGMIAPLHTVLEMKKDEIRPFANRMKWELTDMTSVVRVKA